MKESEMKALLGTAIAKTAMALNNNHELTHAIAEAAALTGEREVMKAMMDLCEHFHAIDDIMKAAAEGLMKSLDAKYGDPMMVLVDPNNSNTH